MPQRNGYTVYPGSYWTKTNYRATINGLQTGLQFRKECKPKTTGWRCHARAEGEGEPVREVGRRGKQLSRQTTFLTPEVTMKSSAVIIPACVLSWTNNGAVVTHCVYTQESQTIISYWLRGVDTRLYMYVQAHAQWPVVCSAHNVHFNLILVRFEWMITRPQDFCSHHVFLLATLDCAINMPHSNNIMLPDNEGIHVACPNNLCLDIQQHHW